MPHESWRTVDSSCSNHEVHSSREQRRLRRRRQLVGFREHGNFPCVLFTPQQKGREVVLGPLFVFAKYRCLQVIYKWTVLDLNQQPPPCKAGQRCPGKYCPVGKSRLSRQFLPFPAPMFSCSVRRVCPALVAARLQHLTLLRPASFSPTLSGSGNPLVRESCVGRCVEQASHTQVQKPGAPKGPCSLSMSFNL